MMLQALTADARYVIGIAEDESCLRQLQALRYDIFVREMGADIHDAEELDRDPMDAHCEHLYVWDQVRQRYVACTRLLTRSGAKKAMGFYSQGEFLMDSIVALDGELLEIGRTCVHPDYRDGSGIALLWQGLAQVINRTGAKHLFGCASVPYKNDPTYVSALMQRLEKYHLPGGFQIRAADPFHPIVPPPNVEATVPPLLKAYLRLGAKLAAEPCIDEQFGVVDFLVLLNTENLSARYARHFKADGLGT